MAIIDQRCAFYSSDAVGWQQNFTTSIASSEACLLENLTHFMPSILSAAVISVKKTLKAANDAEGWLQPTESYFRRKLNLCVDVVSAVLELLTFASRACSSYLMGVTLMLFMHFTMLWVTELRTKFEFAEREKRCLFKIYPWLFCNMRHLWILVIKKYFHLFNEAQNIAHINISGQNHLKK